MKNTSKKIGILVLIMVLGLCNNAIAEDEFDIDINSYQDVQTDKVKANKDTLNKAQEAIDNKDFQTAINLMTAYINSKPQKYEPYKLRGDAYYALRRYDLAQKDYQNAVDIKLNNDKFSTGTKYISAIVLGADKNEQLQNPVLGDLYGALMYAQKAQNNPAYATSYENAIKYNSHIYLPQPKKEDINKINCPQKYGKIINPKGVDEKIYGAVNDIEKSNFHEAIYKLQTVTNEYPNYYLGHYLMGVALAGSEQDDDAIKSFETALKLNPYDFESYASLGQIYYGKAETTFSEKDSAKSIEYFNKALKLNKDCPTYYFYIGMNELQTGNTQTAISNFDKAIKLNPSDYNSLYYKLIAQYINGEYSQVIDGATKLLYKHVSNYNSVMYLRALAYQKTGDNQRALQDLDTIENNIEDIYNADIKQISAKEKSLESYIHYLKSEIQHSQGAGAVSDNHSAYSNPIINRLANAQKTIAPYEKVLEGDSITASDYKKFENFYSTSLPKLLESGAIITYEDIDNQYDYIRTTFDNLGVSFVYQNPDYKITTIKDYPYKKYAQKLSQQDLDSINSESKPALRNIEIQKPQTGLQMATPQSEMIAKTGEQSLAQMLASNALAERAKAQAQAQKAQKQPAASDTKINSDITKAEFKPQTPDAEKVNSGKNIASGEQYTGAPLVNKDNSEKVKNILEEEKSIDENKGSMIFKADKFQPSEDIVIKKAEHEQQKMAEDLSKTSQTFTAKDGSVKISAKEIKETEDIVIKYPEVKPVTDIIKPAQTSITQTASQTLNEINSEKEEIKELTAKEAKKLAKEEEKQAKEQAKELQKLAKNEAKAQEQKLKEQAKELETAANDSIQKTEKAADQIQQNVQEAQKQVIKQVSDTKDKMSEVPENLPKVNQKYANINAQDFGIQTKHLDIDNYNDVVELQTNSASPNYNESDLFTKDRMGFAIAKDNQDKAKSKITEQIADDTTEISKAVTLPEEEVMTNVPTPDIRTAASSQAEEVSKAAVKNAPNPATVTVPTPVTGPEIVVPEITVQTTPVSDEQYVKEKLSGMLNDIAPKSESETSINDTVTEKERVLAQTINQAENLKAQRLKLEQEAKLVKEQAKNRAKEEKQKIKENQRLAKEKARMEKLEIKAQQKALKAQADAEKMRLKEEAKLQKQLQKSSEEITQSQEAAQDSLRAKIEKAAQIEQKELEKAEQEKEKQVQKLVKQQVKYNSEADELKIQLLKERQKAQVLTKEEQKALKEQLKAERKQAEQEYKARKAKQKALEKSNKSSGFFSKLKFWDKNK